MADTAALDAVVAEACSGHKEALAELYREFHGALVGFLFGLVATEAEDLAAETWIDMARALPTFQGDGTEFRRLLFTIARRRAVDHGRRKQRRRTDPADMRQLPLVAADGDPGSMVVDVDASRRAVQEISKLLPRPQAEVVLLRVVAGLSVAETAHVVGRSASAVSVLQNRGLRRLASKLGPSEAATEQVSQSDRRTKPERFRGVERWDG